MPLHIGCMYHLPHLNSKLFLLAHEMVDKEPESHLTWHAVAAWYLAAGKSAEAKVYFGYVTVSLHIVRGLMRVIPKNIVKLRSWTRGLALPGLGLDIPTQRKVNMTKLKRHIQQLYGTSLGEYSWSHW